MMAGFMIVLVWFIFSEREKTIPNPIAIPIFYPVYLYSPVNHVRLGVRFMPGVMGQVGHGGL